MVSIITANPQNQGPGPPLPMFSHFSSTSSELGPVGRLRRWRRLAVLGLRTVWGRLRHHARARALALGPDTAQNDDEDDDALAVAGWERPRHWPPVAPPRPVRPEVAARRAARAAARAQRERRQQRGEETALLGSFTAARLSLMEEDEVERLLRVESEG